MRHSTTYLDISHLLTHSGDVKLNPGPVGGDSAAVKFDNQVDGVTQQLPIRQRIVYTLNFLKNLRLNNTNRLSPCLQRKLQALGVCTRSQRRFRGRRAGRRVQQRAATARVLEASRLGSHFDGQGADTSQPIAVVSRLRRPLTCQAKDWCWATAANESTNRVELSHGFNECSAVRVRAVTTGFLSCHLHGSVQAPVFGIPGGQYSSVRKQRKAKVDRSALILLTDSKFGCNSYVSGNRSVSASADGHCISFPTIFVLNPTSLAKAHAFDQLRCDIESLAVDIAVICESWLKPKHSSDLFTIPDFQLFRCDRIGRVGGGVCVWVRSCFKCKLYEFSRTRSINPLFEFMWLHIQCNDSNEMVICACYHPPKPRYDAKELLKTLVDDLEEVSVRNPGAIIVITGDLNSLNTDFLVYDCGFSLINDNVTHGNRILDKCLVSRPDLYVCRTVQSNIRTRHKALLICDCLIPSLRSRMQAKVHHFCYDIRQPFLRALRFQLGTYNWRSLLQETDIQALYDDFVKVIQWFIVAFIPKKSVVISRKASRFISPLVQLLLRRRNRLLRKGKLHVAGKLSDKIGCLIAEEKSRLLSSVNTHNTKELWSAVDSACGSSRHKSISDLGPPFNDLNAINGFFASIASDPDYDRQHVLSHIKPINNDFDQSSKFFNHFQVWRALQSVHRTAQGSDSLPFWVFKECCFELTEVISHMFNLFLSSSSTPSSWKHSIVTPIPKVHPPRSFEDLRPISVTPILSRVFEKLFVRYLFYPSLPKSLLCDQFAFRPTGSTNAALVQLFHNVSGILETNDFVRCFLIDFSRAFDSVSHTILLDKLSMYGCPQVVISWLANFLTDRTQSVASFSGISNKLAITRSIIQGSGIGPTAFIAMIADLQPSHKTTKLCKYADDLTVVIPGSLFFHGNDEIENIKLWAIQNKLFINTAKSKEIVLRRPRS